MLFPTIEFAVFFAVVFPLTWLLNDFNTTKKWFLVVASYYFYAFWRPEFTLILFASSTANYLVALALGRLPDGFWRRALLWIAVAANLGLLGYFKYYNFFAASLINAFERIGIAVHVGFIEVALPIAISFITFHALSYIIDVYRREMKPTTSLLDILFYISFFPHLIAGPIVRASKFLSQTGTRRRASDIKLGQSVFLILGGLFKKVIIANYLASDFVDGVFRDPSAQTSLDLIFGMYGYALEIYCDFSAYTDIAIGVANLLGYEFPQNFNYPYRAISVQDFWRRWHMSLSSWLRDYLYIPLGGSQHGTAATYRNIMVTMALGGLWHGASWNFLIWGVLHGSALVVERMLGLTGAGEAAGRTPLRRMLGWFGLALGWFITFQSTQTETWLSYFSTMLTGGNWTTTVTPFIAVIFALGALSHLIPPVCFRVLERGYDAAPLLIKVLVPFIVIFLISVAAPSGVAPFIYFQF
jgi:alginate O-acetyltransferase complex protein AlgI